MKIRMRPVTKEDCYDLWSWRNSPEVGKWCFNNDEIDYEEHKKWFNRKIEDENVRIYIAENENGKKLGQVRFEVGEGQGSNISVNLNPHFLGKGLGHRIIKSATVFFLEQRQEVERVTAEIFEENIVSQKAFEKAGYSFAKEAYKHERRLKVFTYNRQRCEKTKTR